MVTEQGVWEGTPSQLSNIFYFIVLILLSLMLVTIPVTAPLIIYLWLSTKFTKYEITTQRLKTRTGIVARNLHQLELYRVKDYQLKQSFFQRMFSIADVDIKTTDKSNPKLKLKSIKNADAVMEILRDHTENRRDAKGVREIDIGLLK